MVFSLGRRVAVVLFSLLALLGSPVQNSAYAAPDSGENAVSAAHEAGASAQKNKKGKKRTGKKPKKKTPPKKKGKGSSSSSSSAPAEAISDAQPLVASSGGYSSGGYSSGGYSSGGYSSGGYSSEPPIPPREQALEDLRNVTTGLRPLFSSDQAAANKGIGIAFNRGWDLGANVDALDFRLVDIRGQNKPFIKFGIRLDNGEFFVQPEAVAKAMGPAALRNELLQNIAALRNLNPADGDLPVIQGALENIEPQADPIFQPAGGDIPGIRCVPGYGPELLSNGTFTTNANPWVAKGSNGNGNVPAWPDHFGGWTYRTGRVEHINGTPGTLEQTVNVATSNSYRLYFSVKGWRSGSFTVSAGGAPVITVNGNGDYEKIFYSAVNKIVVDATSDFEARLDNFSVKAVSALNTGTATEPPCYPSTDTVAYPLWEETKQSDYNPGSTDWGNFTKNMKDALTNPPYSFPLNIQTDASSYIWFKSMPPRRGNSSGAVNGNFSGNANGWTVGTGWQYSGNRMRHVPGAAGTLEQPISGTTAGKMFRTFISVSGRTAGTVSISLGGMSSLAISTNGRAIQRTFTALNSGNLRITADAAFDGYIDEVSVDDAPNPLFQPYSLIVTQWRNGPAPDYLGEANIWGGPINLDCPSDGSACPNRMPDIATEGDCGETDNTATGLEKKRQCLARALKFRDYAQYWKSQCSLENAPAICTDRALNNINANFINTFRNMGRTANTLAWLITEQTKVNEVLPTCGNVNLDHRCTDPGEITSLNTLTAKTHSITSRKRFGDMPYINDEALERDVRGVPKYLFTGKFTGVNDDTVSYDQSLYPYLTPVIRTYTFQPKSTVDQGITLTDQKLYMTQSSSDSGSDFNVYLPYASKTGVGPFAPECAKSSYLENFTRISNRCNPHQGYWTGFIGNVPTTVDTFYNYNGTHSTQDPDRPFTKVTSQPRLFRIEQWQRPPKAYAPYSSMDFAPFGLIQNGDFLTNPLNSGGYWTAGPDWVHDAAGTKMRHVSNTGASSLEQSTSLLIASQPYHLWFTVKRFTKGSVTPWVGGVAGTPITPTTVSPNATCCTEESMNPGTFSQRFTLGASQPIGKVQFVPSADFDGTVEDVSIQHIVPGNTVDRYIQSYWFGNGQSGGGIYESSNLGKCLFSGPMAYGATCPQF